jgi:hypothetical protein
VRSWGYDHLLDVMYAERRALRGGGAVRLCGHQPEITRRRGHRAAAST